MKRYFLKAALLLTFMWVLPVQAYQKNKRKSVSFNSLYSTYSDLTLSASSENSVELKPSIEAEVGLRLVGPFNFLVGGTHSIDQLRMGYGFGFKVDLPGFFFFGSHKRDLTREKKNYPINTSAYFMTYVTQIKSSVTATTVVSAVSNRWGFSIEIFPWNRFAYFIVQGTVYHLQGDSFLSTNLGLGVDF